MTDLWTFVICKLIVLSQHFPMMSVSEELISSSSAFYLIGNIPGSLHSSDLRTFFSRLVEGGVFVCFHYKHRPEHSKNATKTADIVETSTKCCVVALKSGLEEEREFIKSYSGQNWVDSQGEVLPSVARIQSLTVSDQSDHSTGSAIPWSDLRPLPELNPPIVMPRGNVGTPLKTFMDLIRTCKLPGHVIKKLRLEFPKSRTTRRYGAVKLDYGNHDNQVDSGECSVTRDRKEREEDEGSSDESDAIPSDDDHDAEEWERYESLHDDVDKQGRSKERLFEDYLEVVWEKGGSGLVFYTDSAYWHQQEGDFDEQCSKEDDWDVDTSVYYSRGEGASRDAVALRDMAQEKRLREDKDTDNEDWRTVAGFEKHTKGVGSRVLRKAGWRAGQGVGVTKQGMTTPLEVEGQLPSIKKGLGYHGEKLDRRAPKRKRPHEGVLISTVYDKPAEEEDTVLRAAPATTLKYRDFRTGGVLNPHK